MRHERDEPRGDLGALYRAEADFVWRALLRLGVPAEAAEDATQEVFLVAARRLGDFDPTRGEARGWLYGICRGVASNVRRGRLRALRKLAAAPPPEGAPRPDELLAHAEAHARIDQFLEGLDPRQREVFALVDLEGMRGPEVAAALGQPLSAVYSWLRLARRRFVAFAEAERRAGPGGTQT